MLLAASPAAAAKLKLLSEALFTFVLQHGGQVNSVSVRVQPGAGGTPAGPERHPPAAVAGGGHRACVSLYQKMPDSAARKALKKLLDHHVVPENAGGGKS